MSNATDNQKDELVARALSRLPEPPVPEGLAARIAAKAVATPQSPAIDIEPAVDVSVVTATNAVHAAPTSRRSASRHGKRIAAAASVAACVVASATLYFVRDERNNAAPHVAVTRPATVEVIDPNLVEVMAVATEASPRPVASQRKAGATVRQTAPATETTEPSAHAELAVDDQATPSEVSATAAGREQLVRSEPQLSQDNALSAGAAYGPPAPSGFGIAGSSADAGLHSGRGSPGVPSPLEAPPPRAPGTR